MESFKDSSCMFSEEPPLGQQVERNSSKDNGRTLNFREHRRPMWTQHEKTVLRLLMREYAGVTEFDPPDVHKHPIKNEMWQLLTARYNDHSNVRTRDTKQLRKAWENLKYRARKMGGEYKNNSTAGRKSNTGQICSETSWPLDGVSLNISDEKSYENQEILPNGDSKVEIMDNGYLEYHMPKEDSKSVVENGFAEFPILKEPSRVSILTPSNKDKSHSFGNFLKTTVTGTSESIKNYLDSFSNERERPIINLQPLVSSIFGGGLLPFLSPLSSSAFNSDILLNYPFNRSCITPAEEDSGSEASCIKEDSNFRPCSTRPPSSPDPWPSNFSNNAESTVPKPEDDKRHQSCQLAATAATQEYSTPPPESLDSISSETPEFAILKLLNQKTSEEQRHSLSVQLLKMQIAHAEVEHEVKMKLLQTQLEYWQTKLRIQNEEYKITEDT